VAGLHGDTGPNLTHVGSRALLAGEVFQNDSDGLSRWIDHPPDLKPGTTMVDAHLTADQISAIVAYLSSLR
jgi:cytochrome c oxidase subunit 2